MRLWPVLHLRLHDHSNALDGSPIAVAGVPNLPATKITSLRFPMAQMPDGNPGYVLTAQGGGANPVYAASGRANSGSYAGDGTVNKVIAHSLGVTPKIVFIYEPANGKAFRIMAGVAAVIYMDTGANLAVTAPGLNNFYVGNATSYPNSANDNGLTYYWVAIG